MSSTRTISFEELKKSVTPEITRNILAHLGVESRFTAEDDGSLRGPCPFKCEKVIGRSFKITSDGKAWFNHDRACQCLPSHDDTGQPIRGGNMLDFIRFKTGGSIRDAGLLLDMLIKAPKDVETKAKAPKPDAPAMATKAEGSQSVPRNLTFIERNLKPIDLDREHEAIIALGLEPETVAAFNLGVSTKGLMRGRLAFPLHNLEGKLIAYTGLKLDKSTEGPAWLLPKDFNPELEIIGFHRLLERSENPAMIVITFDMLEAAYAMQALDDNHAVITILLDDMSYGRGLSSEQEGLFQSLVKDHGFTGTFLVFAGQTRNAAISPTTIDTIVLRLARIAPTHCTVMA